MKRTPRLRHSLVACALAALFIESWFVLSPARADGGEALLQRLLEDGGTKTAQTAPGKAATATKTTQTTTAARSQPREALRLTPDRTEVIRLDQDAASVVVTNPAHAQVMMETPRLLLVMPRTPGSTSLFVLNADGQAILERDIIVSAASRPYVRIRRSCTGSSCQPDAYYYCPDGCYEVSTVPTSNTQAPPVAGSAPVLDAGGESGMVMENDVPPNARGRSEPAPLPLQEPAGLETQIELDDVGEN